MSKTIEYQIEFFSEWHCGSGLAAGADVDALVVKDKDDLPFVPGKTIKGLIREAADVLTLFGEQQEAKMKTLFGNEADAESGADNHGCLFFSNAELSKAGTRCHCGVPYTGLSLPAPRHQPRLMTME
jgi:CRISPR/Cas system CMR subunit Cmr4 (Cas7 group RAMP superfamily)